MGTSIQKRSWIKVWAFLFLTGVPGLAQAQLSLTSLGNSAQTTVLANALSSTLVIRTLEPATDLGRFGGGFGIAAGAVIPTSLTTLAGITAAPIIPGGNPYVSLFAPFGISADFSYIPPITISSVTFNSVGANLRWAFTRLFPDVLPISMAVQATFTSGGFSNVQPFSGGTLTIGVNDLIFGGSLIVSKQLLFFEPYVAAGFLNQSTTLTATTAGTAAVLLAYQGTANPQIERVSAIGFDFRAGFQIKAFVFILGAEYENSWGNHGLNARIGVKI